jgi:hypothetical protein
VDDWEPELRELTEYEIEKIMKEKERSSRRQRRSQKFNPYASSSKTTTLLPNSRDTRNSWKSTNQVASIPQSFVQGNTSAQGRVTYRNYQPTTEEMAVYSQYNPAIYGNMSIQRPLPNQPQPMIPIPVKNKPVVTIDPGLVVKQVELMRLG